MVNINEYINYKEHIQSKLEILGWSRVNDQNEADIIQQFIEDSKGNKGILLCVDDMPYIFLLLIDKPIIDPLEIYQVLLFGWNLNAWITIMPGPFNSLRFYNTTYKPNQDAIFRGEETAIVQLNLTDFLAIETSHSLSEQFSILLPDTWCTQDYMAFLSSPTNRTRLTVDKALIQDLQGWYQAIILNLQSSSPEVSSNDLSKSAMKIIEQITFMRFCEDYKLTDLKSLSVLVSSSRGEQFLNHFQELVSLYHSIFSIALFDPVKIMPSPSVLQTIVSQITELYKFELLKLDLLGYVFERFLMTDYERNQKGVLYTPEYLIDYLVGRAFYAFEKIHKRKVTSVLDPSCGTGTLLLKAFQNLLQDNEQLNFSEKCKLLETSIFGIDLNHLAIRHTAQMLYFILLSNTTQKNGKLPLPELTEQNLLAKDALLDRKQLIPSKALFDVIINDPPYHNIAGKNRTRYQTLYADSNVGMRDKSWLMLMASIDNLQEGGILSLIIPDKILFSKLSLPVRKYILENTCILEISYLNHKAMFGDIAPLVILLLQRSSSNQARRSNTVQVNYFSTPGVLNREASDEVPQASFYDEDLDYVFNVHLTSPIKTVYDRIKSQSQYVDNYFTYSQGIQLVKSKNQHLIQNAPISTNSKKYIFGKDIQPYVINWSGTYIDYDAKILHRPRRPDIFEHSPKLIIHRIVKDRLIVALDFEKYYASDHAYILVPTVDLTSDLVFLSLAMFSSRLANFCYRVEKPDITTANSRLQMVNIQKLPFPSPELYKNKMLIDAIVKETKALYNQVETGSIMGYSVYQTPRMQEIDSLFTQLYGLTEYEDDLINTYLAQ